ncbi:glycosyltransferase family 2 protein [Candidatus Ventrimonas sp. KK005]|nr:glycosyltransferase family 2 protein [Clostridiaceae bacterium]
MDKISVIVAAYNVEKYIKTCLLSLKNQTYKEIEVIIINDGSTDQTNNIIENFMEENPQMEIKYHQHDTNKGSSAARKTALQYIEGDYIHILDSDDFIKPDTYKQAINRIKETKSDVCFWGWIDLTEDRNILFEYEKKYHYFEDILTGVEVCKRKILRWLWICSGNALYSSSIVKKSYPVFYENLNMGEDFYFICKVLLNSNRVCCVPQQNFYCINRDGSMTHEKYTEGILQVFSLFQKLEEDLLNHNLLSETEKNDLCAVLKAEIRRSYIAYAKLACHTYYKRPINEMYNVIKKLPYTHCSLKKKYYDQIVSKQYHFEYYFLHYIPYIYCIIYKWILYIKNNYQLMMQKES